MRQGGFYQPQGKPVRMVTGRPRTSAWVRQGLEQLMPVGGAGHGGEEPAQGLVLRTV